MHPLYVWAQCRLPLPEAVPMAFLLFLKTSLVSRELLAQLRGLQGGQSTCRNPASLARGLRAPAKYKNKPSFETMS